VETRELLPGVTVSGQPTSVDLAGLRNAGYVAVVNLRRDGEPDQPLSPDSEGADVRRSGLNYLHLPVGGSPISVDDVRIFSSFLRDQSDGKVLVHCRSGGRAVALLLLDQADSHRWPSAEVIERGRTLGLELPPPLLPLVNAYLESRT
jgi:uncharacterized protein (TIGR01244 family)